MGKLEDLDKFTDSLRKKYDSGVIMNLRTNDGIPQVDRIPIGSPKLGKVFGYGGVPRGRIIELSGPESSGKSSICEYIAGQFQAFDFDCIDADGKASTRKGTVVYIDTENSFDAEHAKTQGFDVDKCVLVQPDCGEDAIDIACSYAESGLVDLIVLDSVSNCTPKQIIEGNMDQQTIGSLARLMSKFMGKITPIIKKTRCTLLMTNQLRATMAMWGASEDTTGGNAIKYAYSVRVDVRKKDWIMDASTNTPIGIQIRVKSIKNKTAKPGVVELITMMFDRGIDSAVEWIDFAVTNAVIKSSGAGFFTLPDGTKIRGKDALRDYLMNPDNKKAYDEIIESTRLILSTVKDIRVSSEEPDVVESVENSELAEQGVENA